MNVSSEPNVTSEPYTTSNDSFKKQTSEQEVTPEPTPEGDIVIEKLLEVKPENRSYDPNETDDRNERLLSAIKTSALSKRIISPEQRRIGTDKLITEAYKQSRKTGSDTSSPISASIRKDSTHNRNTIQDIPAIVRAEPLSGANINEIYEKATIISDTPSGRDLRRCPNPLSKSNKTIVSRNPNRKLNLDDSYLMDEAENDGKEVERPANTPKRMNKSKKSNNSEPITSSSTRSQRDDENYTEPGVFEILEKK